MLKTLKIGKNITNSRILSAKFLGLAIIISTFSTSCMAPRPHSIRGKRVEIVTKSPEVREVERKREEDLAKDDSKLDPQEYMKLLDEASKQNSEDIADQSQAISTIEKPATPILKSLDEQIASIEKRQSNTEKNVLEINNKIEYLENSITRLNEVIDNLSSHLPPPSVGPSDKNEAIAQLDKKKDDQKAEFIIKSDEEVKEDLKQEMEKETIAKNDKDVKSGGLVPDGAPKKEIDKLNELSFSLAEAYLEKNDFGKAITKLKEIENRIEEVTEKSKVNMMLGESHFGLKQYAKAINHFIKVLEMPEMGAHDKARMMIADSHLAQGETSKAKGFYKDIVDINPKSNYIPKAKMMLQRL